MSLVVMVCGRHGRTPYNSVERHGAPATVQPVVLLGPLVVHVYPPWPDGTDRIAGYVAATNFRFTPATLLSDSVSGDSAEGGHNFR